MVVRIDCKSCGTEVLFIFEGETERPSARCDECGAMYRLQVERVLFPEGGQ